MNATNILVAYGKRRLLFQLPSSITEFKKAAYDKFSIDNSTPIFIQYFNDTWNEYIDLTQDKEIVPGCKYQIVLQLPEILYVENSFGTNIQNVSDSPSKHLMTNDSQTDTFNSPGQSFESTTDDSVLNCSIKLSEPLSSECSASSNALKNAHFSSRLQEALNEKTPLSRVLRSELVDLVCRSITISSKYPSSIMVTDAARNIISYYPHLKECIGSGYGGWRQAIRDRLKNIRRFDESEEVKYRKKCKIAPEHKQDKMPVEQNSKQTESMERIDQLSDLEKTFNIRRKEITMDKMKINILKSKYPKLFAKVEFEKEFFRVTGKSNLFQCVPSFLKLHCDGLNKMLLGKKLPSWAQTMKDLLDGSGRSIQAVMEIFVLITLPVHFCEEQLALVYPKTLTEDFKEAGSSSPHVGIVELNSNHPKFYVLTEHQIVLEAETFPQAISLLVASYYVFNCEYPKQWKKTFIFMENFIFNMEEKNSKIPDKVVKFIQKLREFCLKKFYA